MNRTLVGSTLILGLVLTAAWLQAGEPEKAPASWPRWRGPTGDCLSSEVPEKLPAEAKPLWKQALSGEVYSGVVVAEGLVVCADSEDDQDFIRCYKADTGEKVWTHQYANSTEDDEEMDWEAVPRATPLIHDGRVYTLAARGDLFCLDLKTGKPAWQKNLATEFGAEVPTWGYCSSPLVAGGNVIVNPGGRASLVALNAKDGKTVWQSRGAGANYASFIVAKVGDAEQLIGYDQTAIRGRSIADGTVLWFMRLDSTLDYHVPSPVAAGGKLVLSDENAIRLHAFAKDGKLQTDSEAESGEFGMENNTPTVLGDLVLGTVKEEGFMGLDLSDDLATCWNYEKEPGLKGFSTVIAGSGRALVLDEAGTLHLFAVDKKECKPLGKLKVCGRTLAAPALAGGRFYVRDTKALYCYDLAPPK